MLKPVMPSIVRRLNERQVFLAIQKYGPVSRRTICDKTGISSRAVLRMVKSLEEQHLIEAASEDREDRPVGRPTMLYQMPGNDVRMCGVVFMPQGCWSYSSTLSGDYKGAQFWGFYTREDYDDLIEAAAGTVRQTMDDWPNAFIMGMAIVIPGRIDCETQRVIDSPKMPFLNGHTVGLDLSEKLGMQSLLVRDIDALCRAEQKRGVVGDINNFAIVDVQHGFNVAVMSDGDMFSGNNGLLGQFIHVPAYALDGNNNSNARIGDDVLDSKLQDKAAAKFDMIRYKDRYDGVDYAMQRLYAGKEVNGRELSEDYNLDEEIEIMLANLSVVLELMIYAFGSSLLLVRSDSLNAKEGLLERLVELTESRLPEELSGKCKILQSRQNEMFGATMMFVDHLIDQVGPVVP